MRNKLMCVILNLIQDLPTRWSLLFFAFFLVGVSIVLFTRHTIAQEKSQQAYDVACEISDVPTLQDCIKRAKNKEYDLIKIIKIIECQSKDDCAIDLSGVEKAIKIYGITNTDTGFKRTGNFDYSLFTIKNSKDIVIGSFLIDDTSEGGCPGSCPPAIVIENSTNITVDQLSAKSVKSTAISVKDASSIAIKDSVFTDSSSAALLFSADGTNSITNNTFMHNHKDALYEACRGICTGAQVQILPNTKNVRIEKNIIRDGQIDIYNAFGLYASGIEIAGRDVGSVTMSCNKIYGNSGNGVVIPNRETSTQQVIMKQNAIYNNGINVNVETGPQDQVDNNCFDFSCKIDGC